MGGHGFLGAIAGAIAGSKLEDKAKKAKHGHHHNGRGEGMPSLGIFFF